MISTKVHSYENIIPQFSPKKRTNVAPLMMDGNLHGTKVSQNSYIKKKAVCLVTLHREDTEMTSLH